jgi:hypothetical protein
MAAFRRSAPHLLESAFARDLRFRMAGRVKRRGRDYFATRLMHDFEDAVTGVRCESSRASRSRPPDGCSTARPSSRSPPRPPTPSADRLPLT